jgi:glucokinase-like ROK family protein
MGIGREVSKIISQTKSSVTQSGRIRSNDQISERLCISPLENELILLIRKHGNLTKADLVEHTDYSRTKITQCIDSLVAKNIIKSNGSSDFTGGRRSRTYSFNGELGFVAGIDIGATSIDVVLSDFSRNVISRKSISAIVRDGPQSILTKVSDILFQIFRENNLNPEKLTGIGIGVPGPVDFSLGTVLSPPIMPGWDRFPIISTMQKSFPLANIVVDNDVNLMALGEVTHGAAKDVNNIIFLKIGTGIGAGIISFGKIYRGSNGCAGDVGHICADKNGPICSCGNAGCLEAVAAGPAIAERGRNAAISGNSPILNKYLENNGGFLRAEDVGDAAREGDPTAIEIIRSSGELIGDVLASLVNFYNPDMIIIGGGVSNIGNLLLSSIRQGVLNRSLPLATRDLQIVFSAIGPQAGIIGAVSLAIEHMFTVECNNALTILR